MYEVAICDDEARDREFLKKELCENEKYGDLLRIHEYGAGRELLKEMEKIKFSIIFMDIKMRGMDGEGVAEEIRKRDDSVIIVFFSGYAKPTMHSIEVQPYRFIKKNMPDVGRREYIDASLQKMVFDAGRPTIIAKIKRKKIVLRSDDIVYIEKYKKFLKVHLSPAAMMRFQIVSDAESDVRIYDKLDNLYELLKPCGFGYPHSSYIINFKYIVSCGDEEIELEGFPNIIFKVTRSRMAEFNNMKQLFLISKYESRGKR